MFVYILIIYLIESIPYLVTLVMFSTLILLLLRVDIEVGLHFTTSMRIIRDVT